MNGAQWAALEAVADTANCGVRICDSGERQCIEIEWRVNETFSKYNYTPYEQGGVSQETVDTLTQIFEEKRMNIYKTAIFEYLMGDMIPADRDIALTAGKVTIEKLQGRDEKPVLHFTDHPKKLVLSKPIAKALAQALGPETDDWLGAKIVLYSTEVTAFGATVRAIRVRNATPAPKKAAPKGKGQVTSDDMIATMTGNGQPEQPAAEGDATAMFLALDAEDAAHEAAVATAAGLFEE